MSLELCVQCQRHVDEAELACPHCGSRDERPPVFTRRVLLRSRLAIVAGAALTVVACGGSSGTRTDGDPDPDPDPDPDTDSGGGSGGSGGEIVDEREASCAGQCGSHHACDDNGQCPPYGAPPLPDTIV